MEKGDALSRIQELLEKVHALADTLIITGSIDEGEVNIKPATVRTLGKMINIYVIKIYEALEQIDDSS